MYMIIVTSHWNEDLTWLASSPWPVVLIDKEGAESTCFQAQHVIPNRGREASAYLKYIVENYENLPETVAFIHGHETSSHQKHDRPLLDVIAGANVAKYGFVPINNMNRGGEFADHHCRLYTFWDALCLGTVVADGVMPYHRGPMVFDLGAQFVVRRDRILRNPKKLYEGWLHIMLTNPDFADELAYILEETWHVIFGEPFINAPRDDWFSFKWTKYHT